MESANNGDLAITGEHYYCANCSSAATFKSEPEDHIEYINNSCLRKVSNMSAIMEIYRMSCKHLDFETPSLPKLSLCSNCSGVLSDLYKLYEQFNSLRKVDSLISQLIASAEISSASSLGSIDFADVNTEDDGVISKDEDSSCEFLEDKSQDFVVHKDKGNDEDINPDIVVLHEHSISDIQFPLPNGLVLDGNNFDPNNQLGASDQEELSMGHSSESNCWIVPPKSIVETPLVSSTSTTTTTSNNNASETPWEFPRSTTAIAVPIGDNLLQLYRVAPILPTQPPFTCIQCGKTKKSLISLRNHIHNVHDTHKSVSCPKCLKVFRKPCLLRKHAVVHEKGYEPQEKRFKKQNKPLLVCSWPGCGRSFQYNTSLQRHEARHRPERPFVCQHCHKGFKLVGDLRLHMEFHKDSRPYICDKCGKTYKVASNLNTHIVNAHTEEGRLKYNEYMRMKTRQKRLNNIASELSRNMDTIIETDLVSNHGIHEDFPDFIVSEAEIGTEEITVEFS